MTKKEARARKQAWQQALIEGRVVNINHGQTLISYPTVARAEEVVCLYTAQGIHALIAGYRIHHVLECN